MKDLMAEEFNQRIRESGYPEALTKLSPEEKVHLSQVLTKTFAVWSTLPAEIRTAIVMTSAAGIINDRLDVVSIALDELIDKASELNTAVTNMIFSVDAKTQPFAEVARTKHLELITKSKQYQKGLPEGYCKVLLALTADTFVLGMKALEQAYTANAALIKRGNLTLVEKKEVLAAFTTRSMDSWSHLITNTKSWISEHPDKYKIGQCRHEARHFDWMRREGMSEKEAAKVAMQAGVTYQAQYSFLAWFVDETH